MFGRVSTVVGMPDYIEAKLKTYDINKLYGRMYIKALFTDGMQA